MTQKIAPCPEQELLQKIAAGECPPDIEKIVSHAAQCKTCGPLLKKYLAIFSDETTPEEKEFISCLQTSDPEVQREWVRTHVARSSVAPVRVLLPEDEVNRAVHQPWWRISSPWRWRVAIATGALAAIIVAVIAVPAVIAANKISTAKKLVATGFADRRTTELRPSSAPYAQSNPFPHTLGDESRDLDQISPSLLEARSMVAKELKGAKIDPHWLQIEGRIFLWESTPASLEKAQKAFEGARAAGLNTADLDIDLAATYFELDSRDNHPNLQRTLNLLSKVLTEKNLSKENRATALFNLAIAYEKTQAWDLAANTWKEYLSVDSSSPWADEARKRLKDAQSRTAISPPELYVRPSDFLSHASDAEMRDYAEEYQDIALTDWLPHVVDDADSRQAGLKMAESMAKEHGDSWLRDMFQSFQNPDGDAVRSLIEAIHSNLIGKHEDARDQAKRAAAAFRKRRNLPGELRATYEAVYAERRFLNGAGCLAAADDLGNRLSGTNYRWLQARVLLERAECSNLNGNFAESDSSFKASRDIADKFDFPLIALRNLSVSSGVKRLRGDYDESWKESVGGLQVYWKAHHASRQRLFEFYAVMLQCSLDTGALYSAESFIDHAIDMRQRHAADFGNNPTLDGLLHLHLANIFFARQEISSANEEKKEAVALLRILDDPTAEKYRLIAEIEPAELQLDHGDAMLALETLKSISADGSSDGFFRVRYHQALGNVLFRIGKFEEASREYKSAIETAEAAHVKNEAERSQWFHAIDESYRGLVRVLIEQGQQDDALSEWEHYKDQPVIRRITEKVTRPSVAYREISQPNKVDPVTPGTRLVYAMFRDGLQIWARRNGSVKGFWVKADEPNLENEMRDFSAKCANEESNLNELQRQGTGLYALLVQPVSQELHGSETLTIELDRRAYNLPMEALRSPDGAYLGQKYPILYSPGTGLEANLRVVSALNEQARFVFVDGSSEYLPGIDAERKAVSQLYPHSTILDAPRSNVSELRLRSRENDIWHYTGHGRRDGSGTRLDFSRSQSLRAADFTAELFSRSQLVVLAACSSALSGDRGLVDTNSLVHALLAAGVPHVIASRWNVDSLATSHLMISFYTHLVKGATVAEALAASRNEVLTTRAHPYFWAGFSLTGRAS